MERRYEKKERPEFIGEYLVKVGARVESAEDGGKEEIRKKRATQIHRGVDGVSREGGNPRRKEVKV